MGLITRLKAIVGRGQDPEYVCEACGAGFQTKPQLCPECGGMEFVSAG